MKPKSDSVQTRELLLTVGPAIVLVVGTLWLASWFIQPAPPHHVVIAAASRGSPYYRWAEQYQRFMAQNGIDLEIRETGGSIENLRLLEDSGSGVQLGFLQGGISSSQEAPQLRSIGRVFYEPLWVFYHGDQTLDRLTQLVGKRVLVGPAGGGTNYLAQKLLNANGVTPQTATLINMELPDYVDALGKGEADAGFLVLAPDAKTIQRLFGTPNVRLMNLVQADAYSERFPYLSHLELRQGLVDFARNIPAGDVNMVATMAAVVVRDDLHPALTNLMTQALIDVHTKPMIDANGEVPVFSRAAEFPVTVDPEFPLAAEARRVYKSGPPFLQRYLPFWLATLSDRLVVLLIPIIGLALPLMRFVPPLYTWRVRQRILQWYRELKRVEATVHPGASPQEFARAFGETDRIEAAVDHIRVPLGFSDQLFHLREHIEVVRRRLAALQRLANADARAPS